MSLTLILLGVGGSMVIMQQFTPGTATTPAPSSIKGTRLYIERNSNASKQAAIWRYSMPEQAEAMDTLAALPTAKWLTTTDTLSTLPAYFAGARKQQAIPVLVVYTIPERDCGRYSAGGAASETAYRDFIAVLAQKIAHNPAILILEPDALPGINAAKDNGQPCLTNKTKTMYYSLLRHAVTTLKALPATYVYIDAGNSAWDPNAPAMADRLKRAGVAHADGFSLNISNFQTTVNSIAYGNDIASHLGNKHFVIDTARNGLGPYNNPVHPAYNWCNPPGRALGHAPTTDTGHTLVDAFLYIKYPGESDGTDPDATKCFGGPAAGTWWPEYALGLIERWPKELRKP